MDKNCQIENRIYLYAERIDNGDLERVSERFRNGQVVSIEYGVDCTGYREVLNLYQTNCRVYDSTEKPMTKHLTTSVIIEVSGEGNVANARSCYTVIQATESLPLQPIIAGRYVDCFRRPASDWEFSRREMIVDLMDDSSAHMLYDSSSLSQ